MLVITTAPAEKQTKPKVIVTLAAKEIDALLAGGAQRFPVAIGDTTHDVELIAASTTPPRGPKPSVRLRVADDAINASRAGTVTPIFVDVPFQLVLMCSDPPPAGPVRIGPGLSYQQVDLSAKPKLAPTPMAPQRDTSKLPLTHRLAIGGGLGLIIAIAGYFQGSDAPLFYCGAIGIVLWSVFGDTNPASSTRNDGR